MVVIPGLDYTLAVLTHGNMDTLDRSLASFFDKVKPRPNRVIVHGDAPSGMPSVPFPVSQFSFTVEPRGFCKATGALWHWASAPGQPGGDLPEFVFWLEHDFVFLRPVDLEPLSDVLNADKSLAQMSLMRTPVSPEEISAGGVVQSRPGEFEEHLLVSIARREVENRWLRHRSYFTTTPSLMRTDFMMWNHWPDDDLPECEGRFGIDLVQRGFEFGVWGSGEPWVEHIGVRTGVGY